MKASDNPFPSLLLVEQSAAPAAPAAGSSRLYVAADGTLHLVDETGADVPVAGSGSVGAWADYTPTLTAATTNPTLGTGSIATGRYQEVGDTVHFHATIAFGSSGVNIGSGTYFISLPVPAAAAETATAARFGMGEAFDASSGISYLAAAALQDANRMMLRINGSSQTVGSAAPMTFDAGDYIMVSATYQKA